MKIARAISDRIRCGLVVTVSAPATERGQDSCIPYKFCRSFQNRLHTLAAYCKQVRKDNCDFGE